MNSSNEHQLKNTVDGSELCHMQSKRVSSKDVYDWALYELTSARRVELGAGVDTSDLRQQVVFMLQKDLYNWLGDDLTI